MVGKRALELGFTSTIGIIHDGDGQLRPLGRARTGGVPGDEERSRRRTSRSFNHFQEYIAHGTAKRLALPGRGALPVCVRRRSGALLLAAARLSRQAAR